MYKCNLCSATFEKPKNYSEDLTPGEAFEGDSFIYSFCGCPVCSCTDYEKIDEIIEDEENGKE